MTTTPPLHTNNTKKDFDKFRSAFIQRIAFARNIPASELIKAYTENFSPRSTMYLSKNMEDLEILKKRIEPQQQKIYNEWLEEEKKKGNIVV